MHIEPYINMTIYSVLKGFLPTQDVTRENKLRLLMIYAAVHPEKFEGDKIAKLMEVCSLTVILNLDPQYKVVSQMQIFHQIIQ